MKQLESEFKRAERRRKEYITHAILIFNSFLEYGLVTKEVNERNIRR